MKKIAKVMMCLLLGAAVFFAVGCNEKKHEHVFSDWQVTEEATCEKEGKETAYCSCGEKQERTIAKLPHEFGEWQTVIVPEPGKEGKEERVCSACGYKESRAIEPSDSQQTTIYTEQQLIEMAAGEKDGNYKLGADITLTKKWNTAGVFKGVLDGDGHTIYNMEIESSALEADGTSIEYMVAMFSKNEGTIKNVAFENFMVTVTADDIKKAGYEQIKSQNPSAENIDIHIGITGLNKGTMQKIRVNAYITALPQTQGARLRTGVVAGKNNAEIKECITTGTLTLKNSSGYIRAGGITGYISNGGVIENSESNVSIVAENSGAKNNIGGIVGNIECGSVLSCYFGGSIDSVNDGSKSTSAGAIAGLLDNQSMKYETMDIIIDNCFSRAEINDSANKGSTGGIIGEIEAIISDNMTIALTNCSANSTATGAKDQGGFLGDLKLYDKNMTELNYPVTGEYINYITISNNECSQQDNFAEVKLSSLLRQPSGFELAKAN